MHCCIFGGGRRKYTQRHIVNTHGGLKKDSKFEDFLDIHIVKVYKKPITRIVEEGVCLFDQEGKSLSKETEWHQPKIIRTTII